MENKNPDEVFASIVRDLDYRVDWKVKAISPGSHKSGDRGSGHVFKDITRITDAPGQRRLDVRSSIRSSDGIPRVRIYEQRSKTKIYLVVDLSASVSWTGLNSKRIEMAKLACVLGYSAYRTGDLFGFSGYGEELEIDLKPAHSKEAGFLAGKYIWNSDMRAKNHGGLKEVAEILPTERSLIFWFSDFYFSSGDIEDFLCSISRHKVIGVSFSDNAEQSIPRFGIFTVRDNESGGKHSVLMRPSLRKQILSESLEREKKLSEIFGNHGSEVYFNKGEADLEKFQNWLL